MSRQWCSAPVDYRVMAGKSLLKRIKAQVESADAAGTTLAVTEDELRRVAQMGSHTFHRQRGCPLWRHQTLIRV
jgi:hypothetical protein